MIASHVSLLQSSQSPVVCQRLKLHSCYCHPTLRLPHSFIYKSFYFSQPNAVYFCALCGWCLCLLLFFFLVVYLILLRVDALAVSDYRVLKAGVAHQ